MTTDSLALQLSSFQSRLLVAIHGISEDALRKKEGEGKWSIFDVITHLGDVELFMTLRVSMIVAEENPALPRFTQNLWVERLHDRDSTATVLENFWHLRRRNVAFLRSLSGDELTRTGVHPEWGAVTVPGLLEHVASHQEKHLGQIERIKKTLAIETKTTPHLDGVVASQASSHFRSPGPGIRVRDLWQGGASRAFQVEFDAGAQWPGLDYHVPGPEEVYVVAGDFNDGVGHYQPGTFLHHPAGSSHSPTSQNGCVLFVYYPEG